MSDVIIYVGERKPAIAIATQAGFLSTSLKHAVGYPDGMREHSRSLQRRVQAYEQVPWGEHDGPCAVAPGLLALEWTRSSVLELSTEVDGDERSSAGAEGDQ